MPDSVTIIARGRTDMLVQSRAGVTEIRLPIVAPTVSMEIVGGAPGPRGLLHPAR